MRLEISTNVEIGCKSVCDTLQYVSNICLDGRPVYFDNVNSVSAQGNSGIQGQYRSGYGNYDLKNGKNSQDSSRQSEQSNTQGQSSGSDQNSAGVDKNSPSVDRSNSDSDRANLEKRNDSTNQNEFDSQKKTDAKLDANNPTRISTDVPSSKP